ncbi:MULTISPECIES: LysR substrate-binding domain-containing protein [unclassified Caulobacter]|uniref:LysR substrate-binding domain-containing protein n=1 Tax=unclassified Caulobacter TaxID=2648921 RepID=UPI0009E7AA6D|nr:MULTISPECIES: LysR substrate-binding domain-containing protein [unclassified Caulobacter]
MDRRTGITRVLSAYFELCLTYGVQRRLPPLESLRVLEACVRTASFSRAAAELGVTPSAVSLRIRDLEAELGVALFHRSGPRVSATAAGQALAASLGEALALVRSAVETCVTEPPTLRLSAPPTFAARWLAPRLARYRDLPGAVSIQLDVSAEVRASHAFDLAIRTGLGDWPGLDAVRLMPIDATPMLSPGLLADMKLERPEHLAALPLLPHADWPRWFAEAGVSPPALRFVSTDYPTQELDASAALDGAGVALLSPTLFAPLLAQGALVRPFARAIEGPASHYLLSHPGEARTAVLDFVKWLRECPLRA